jgi:hypothetical protein
MELEREIVWTRRYGGDREDWSCRISVWVVRDMNRTKDNDNL